MYGSSKQLQVAHSRNGLVERDVATELEISPKVMELDLEELCQANRLLSNSHAVYTLNQLNDLLKSGYTLNPLEQRLFDKFIDNYNTNFRSPLATAMKEE